MREVAIAVMSIRIVIPPTRRDERGSIGDSEVEDEAASIDLTPEATIRRHGHTPGHKRVSSGRSFDNLLRDFYLIVFELCLSGNGHVR